MTGIRANPRGVLRRRRDAAAPSYAGVAPLMEELQRRMLERLDLVRLPEGPLLDLGCATGAGVRALRERYPATAVVGADLSMGMLGLARGADPRRPRWLGFGAPRNATWLCADPERLPFRPGAFAMVWSCLTPLIFLDPQRAWRALGSALRPGGLLTFTTLGPDTLRELRGSAAPAAPFADMHDIGDALVHAGFAAPVMDMERVTLTYESPLALFRDLRASGLRGGERAAGAGLTGAGRRRTLFAAWEARRTDGRLPATLEIVYGHAWWPEAGPARTEDGAHVVRIARRRGP